MSALPLLDYVLASSAGTSERGEAKERLTEFGASLVKSVLDDLARVDLFEKAVAVDNEDFRFDRDAAVLVRYCYEECMKRAEQVLQRVTRLEAMGHKVKGAQKLHDAHGRLAAMLSVSLEEIAASREQSNKGKLRTAAELRHELQTRLHK